MKKRFIVRKYVMARNGIEALKLERKQKADECWIDEEWLKANTVSGETNMGFATETVKKK